MLQFDHIAREVFNIAAQRAAQGMGCHLVSTWRASQAKVNAAGIKAGQSAKLFGDDQGRVIGQHDTTGANSNSAGAASNITNHHCRGGAGDATHVVVFRYPITLGAQTFSLPSQIQ